MKKRPNQKAAVYRLLFAMAIMLTLVLIAGGKYRGWELDQKVMASELSQLPVARAKVQEVATKDAELQSLRQVAEATKSSKPNVIYIDRATSKGKALEAVAKKWGSEHLKSFESLISHESGFNPLAQNRTSTAFGMFQFLDTTWKNYGCEKTTDVDTQIHCGLKYITARYGNPNNAWEFWQKNKWY